jgi:hypothetical protein
MLRKTVIPIALVAGLLFPTVAGAKSYTIHSGRLTATLTAHGTLARPQPPLLTITESGQLATAGVEQRALFDGTVTARGCGTACVPSVGSADPPLRFAAIDGAGSHDLLVTLYSGGANCCTVLDLLRPSAALNGDYVQSAQHNFGYAGYRLDKQGGSEVFVTADNSFAFAFTDFADSAFPLQVLHLSGVKFEKVTAHYPALVRRDAARAMTAYRRADGKNDVGLIAAWAADEATLGRWPSAHAYLVSQARAGRLTSTLYPKSASGMRFITELQALLRRDGYLK